jgi:opacity protein-like surface antigen
VEAGYLDISSDSHADFFGRDRGPHRGVVLGEGDLAGVLIFANAVLTWPVADWIAPYVGAGVGGFFSTDDSDFIVSRAARAGRRDNPGHAPRVFTRDGDDGDFSFAFQVKAGVDFRLWPGITIGPEYRFTWIDRDSGGSDDSIHIHAVGATVKFNF